MRYSEPVLLDATHPVDGFCCGKQALDEWIVKRANSNQRSGSSRTWITMDEDGAVAGYYASATSSILRSDATSRAGRNQPEQIPAILLGRLAVDQKHRDEHLGSALLKHFILKGIEVSQIVGVRLLLVHAMDDEAHNFYLHHDFEPSPFDSLTLMLTIQDAIAA